MDVFGIIAELLTERDRIQRIIESLETMLVTGDVAPRRGRPPGSRTGAKKKAAGKKKASRRGRPPMSAGERAAQSARMKALWAKRRGEASGAEGSDSQGS